MRSEPLPPRQTVDIRLHLAEILSRANLFPRQPWSLQQQAHSRGDLLYDLALANFRAGHLDDALASAEHAKSAADNGSLEILIGDIQEKRGDPLAAVHAYQPAVYLEPSEERYHLALGLESVRRTETVTKFLVLLEHLATHVNRYSTPRAL